ncbi:MAG TPA: hypothetical protein DDX98_01650 [Bacteroidales bacterium]|nr:hypothetical protein [Bacteroidales bacterium]
MLNHRNRRAMKYLNQALFILFILCIAAGNFNLKAQENDDTLSSAPSLYKPYSQRFREQDSLLESTNQVAVADSMAINDSLTARLKFIEDSIAIREQFVRDSILAREQFVRDSLLERRQILDSLKVLKSELPKLLQASILTLNDDVVIHSSKIEIIGDSTLTDYSYLRLPIKFNEPYTPWRGEVNLSDNPAEMDVDTIKSTIHSIKAPGIHNQFKYGNNKQVLIVMRQGMFASKYGKKYYKAPIDSVFFDSNGKVKKIKRYYAMYQATDNFQLGGHLFDFLWQVKQYGYKGQSLSDLELVKFCDRWSANEQSKVCNISRYQLKKLGYSYEVVRTNDPVNQYSDGTYRYEFDNLDNLKAVSFRNTKGTENWKTFIEINEKGYVTSYVYQNSGIVNRSLLIYYYLDNPEAKHPVETISVTYEDDGVSYFQRNNTTGKTRSRDRVTGEWSRWQE